MSFSVSPHSLGVYANVYGSSPTLCQLSYSTKAPENFIEAFRQAEEQADLCGSDRVRLQTIKVAAFWRSQVEKYQVNINTLSGSDALNEKDRLVQCLDSAFCSKNLRSILQIAAALSRTKEDIDGVRPDDVLSTLQQGLEIVATHLEEKEISIIRSWLENPETVDEVVVARIANYDGVFLQKLGDKLTTAEKTNLHLILLSSEDGKKLMQGFGYTPNATELAEIAATLLNGPIMLGSQQYRALQAFLLSLDRQLRLKVLTQLPREQADICISLTSPRSVKVPFTPATGPITIPRRNGSREFDPNAMRREGSSGYSTEDETGSNSHKASPMLASLTVDDLGGMEGVFEGGLK